MAKITSALQICWKPRMVISLWLWAHYELVTIHPWVDGNGRTCRLLMNLLQMEYNVLPTKVLKHDKAEYIQALIDTCEKEDINIFLDCMACLHIRHLQNYIQLYEDSMKWSRKDFFSSFGTYVLWQYTTLRVFFNKLTGTRKWK